MPRYDLYVHFLPHEIHANALLNAVVNVNLREEKELNRNLWIESPLSDPAMPRLHTKRGPCMTKHVSKSPRGIYGNFGILYPFTFSFRWWTIANTAR